MRVSVVGLLLTMAISPTVDAPTTTAWQNGTFVMDTPGVVHRSDVILSRANTAPTESMPLGNGALGAAVWAANGFTAQLNRTDTFPDRKSLGQVVIPGLARMTTAPDFAGRLDLYDGMLRQSGGGMTMTAYVRADAQQLVVDVTGADPNSAQTAQVKLWDGRNPTARAAGPVATLAETWVDNTATGASGRTFGAMTGVSAGGRNVTASTPDTRTAQVSFNPNVDGSYRIVVAAPQWIGGDAVATAGSVINGDTTRPDVRGGHLDYWHTHWANAGLIKITSPDGTGDYVENLRTLNLYFSAAQSRGTLPGSQAGVADLFTFSQDHRDWYPAGYWFWNLRMQMLANMTAGLNNLNDPVFRLYRDNANAIATWTQGHYPGHQGLCVPETIRFNGNGYYAGGDAANNASCDSTIAPSWNARNVTTGAEVGLWVWWTYQMTDDRAFLSANYPLIRGAAQFLLSHATTGADGELHTRSNAHETQWDVTDPTTDIAAMHAFLPVVVQAAQTLGVDTDLVAQVDAAIPKLQPLPRTDTATQQRLLTPADDAAGTTMIGMSTQPTATRRNSENIGLEAVWPYSLIGDGDPLGRRTFTSRSYVNGNDWSYDALHAARLGLGADMRTALLAAIRSYQVYPSGLASFTGQPAFEPYVEQSGVLAAAVAEGLVQDYDGLLRIAPAWPTDWTGEGTVAIQHRSKVHVQVSGGVPTTVAIEAGSADPINVRNPWPGQSVSVVDGVTRAVVVPATTSSVVTIPAAGGRSYLVKHSPTNAQPFAPVSGTPATAPKRYDRATIGVVKQSGTVSLRARANGQYVTAPNGSPLIAGKASIGTDEQFDLVDLGSGNVALKARSNGQYVTAENAGAQPLIANRAAVGPWETFQLVHNNDGTVSFRAQANGKYVCAENAGAAPLVANRDAIGPWESFDLVSN
ncbi:hypothetical protein GCM10029964_036010 [Kibdelosporangium lantanae]